jgi:Sec-independent protein secretion pathway component TatC
MYIALIPITFAVKNKTKVVGIILLVIGVITTAITNLWGIIPFALLLPAGILSLRFKKRKATTAKKEEEEEEEKEGQ